MRGAFQPSFRIAAKWCTPLTERQNQGRSSQHSALRIPHAAFRTSHFFPAHLFLLAVCIGAVVLLHLPQLRLPYYWDEAGYYIPAARDFYLTGDPIPHSTHTNPHPPLLSLYLAAAWKLFGFSPLVTRLAIAVIAGAALYVLLLLGALAASPSVGLWAAVWTATTPVFLAQSTLAHLDMAATLGVLATLYFFLRRRLLACAVAGALLCLVRETGAVVVVTLAALELGRLKLEGGRQKAEGNRDHSAFRTPHSALSVCLLVAPLIPLAAWFAYLRWRTGLWLGDAYFASYNVWGALHAARGVVQFGRRLYQLGIANFHWVATAMIVGSVIRSVARRPPAVAAPRGGARHAAPVRSRALAPVLAVMAAYVTLLTVFGGPLARYLLPVFPLFFLLAARAALQLSWRGRDAVMALLPVLFTVCWYWNPPYPFAYEDNLAYADFVRLHRDTAPLLEQLPSGTRILTAWPASDQLSRPWLGYVSRPLITIPVAEFTRQELGNVPEDSFDVLFLFSRQWHPDWFDRFPRLTRVHARLFGYQQQAPAEWIAQRFGLRRVTHIESRGQWVEIWAKSRIPHAPLPTKAFRMSQFGAPKLRYLTCNSISDADH